MIYLAIKADEDNNLTAVGIGSDFNKLVQSLHRQLSDEDYKVRGFIVEGVEVCRESTICPNCEGKKLNREERSCHLCRGIGIVPKVI